MPFPLSRAESGLLLAAAGLLALAVFGPALQPLPAGHFADARAWGPVPNAADVLSNLAFLVAGIAGARVALREPLAAAHRLLALVFFAGLGVTAFTSGWYHLAPDATRLVADRLGMGLAFSGLIGLAVASRISDRAGLSVMAALLLAAPPAAFIGQGNEWPWAVVQFGGLALLVGLSTLRARNDAPAIDWLAVIALYAIAKLCEVGDAAVLGMTGHLVSGHTLKHLVAACAAWPVLRGLRWHNRPTTDGLRTARAAATTRRSPR